MNGKYKNKYRIKSARLQGYDYRTAGFYFVTICTENRYNYFGEIINQRMQLSHIGILSNVFWYEIVNHAKNIKLHQFVAMPNHIHGILEIADGDGNDDVVSTCIVSTCIVSTRR
jgi:REP element-mobilizing transposase RayT